MSTPIVLPLASAQLRPITGDQLNAEMKQLAEREKTAHEKYNENCSLKSDTRLETVRDEVIQQLNKLRSQATFCVSDSELQTKTWCQLTELITEAYVTTAERSLNLVKNKAGQIEAILNSYNKVMIRRLKIRWVAVGVSVFGLVGIGWFLYKAHLNSMNGQTAIPILGVPSCVLLWSVIGSFAAILYRFTNAGDRELDDPLRWLFSRPLTGIIMGTITFLVIRAGLLTMAPVPASNTADKLATNEVMWLVAFLAGFSDRFADGLLKSLVGRFGRDKTTDLLSMQIASTQASARDEPNSPPALSIVEKNEAPITAITKQ